MLYQLTWKILPGLRGLSCSEFRATPTDAPETERGVVFEAANQEENAALIAELERRFATERFTNNASAFETVKAYAMERAARPAQQ
ncbi:MAG: hypothetical protein ACRD5R_15250 [Candidatus Acidiferrales bacterium]